ncbi:Crp/Fnr family transcriptional regulator [Desertivirga xinjiangensis]|uniref:Crp/Fnr family transcriptional regulator n=1 Tax=Desertivirga xinjiangensis TaxID=539206 RepID=UPI00210E3E15|nr:Crp/Fnr family transcriptional regulator [Pedobacter xinjiangensis]
MFTLLVKHITNVVSLSNEEIILLTSHFKHKTLKKKQYLLEQGEVARYEYFIIKGCLKTFNVNQAGEESILSFSTENWWVGDLYSFWTGNPSSYSISALEDCELLYIDNDVLETLYLLIPKLERYFRILLKNAYVASQRRIILTINQTAEERYIDFIKRYPDLEQRIPQYMVASYLGITPEFLSKIRRKIAHKPVAVAAAE